MGPEARSKGLKRSGAREMDGRVAQRARLVSGLEDVEKTDPQNTEDMANDGWGLGSYCPQPQRLGWPGFHRLIA